MKEGWEVMFIRKTMARDQKIVINRLIRSLWEDYEQLNSGYMIYHVIEKFLKALDKDCQGSCSHSECLPMGGVCPNCKLTDNSQCDNFCDPTNFYDPLVCFSKQVFNAGVMFAKRNWGNQSSQDRRDIKHKYRDVYDWIVFPPIELGDSWWSLKRNEFQRICS